MKKIISLVLLAVTVVLIEQSIPAKAMSIETTELTTGEVTIEQLVESDDQDDLNGFSGMLPGPEPYEPSGIGLNAIIGEDNRVVINNPNVKTYRCIGKLYITCDKEVFSGTAFLVGPKLLLTAAHCAYNDKKSKMVDSIFFIPAKNGSSEPYGRFDVTKIHVPTDYKTACANNDDSKKKKYDFAVLELGEAIGDQLGYLALGGTGTTYDTSFLTGKKVKIAGYPVSENVIGGKMYKHDQKVLGFYNDQCDMRYTVDTEGGQSGSPVLYYNADTSKYYVVGIHTRNDGKTTHEYNIGRYMGKAIKDMVKQYK